MWTPPEGVRRTGYPPRAALKPLPSLGPVGYGLSRPLFYPHFKLRKMMVSTLAMSGISEM